MSLLHIIKGWIAKYRQQREPSPASEPSAQQLAAIEANVRLVQAEFSDLSGHELPPGRAGVEFLNGFIERRREQQDDNANTKLAEMLACYLGASLIAVYGGKWVRQEGFGLGAEVSPTLVVFPFAKTSKHFSEGSGDSVLSLFNAVAALRHTPTAEPAPDPRELPAKELASIKHKTRVAQAELAVTPERAGVEKLDDLIESRRGDTEGQDALATAAGYCFGAALVARYGARWIRFNDEMGYAIEFADGTVVFPFEQAQRCLIEGPTHSLLALFDRLAGSGASSKEAG